MVITELYIRNFGKLSEQHFYLRDGVQVISGENEFGKTTLHAFIRAMLFGMERGRGRAAAKDDFSRYEPWDNPGNYAGIMRFTCGGRGFRLERDFSRHTRHTSLVCEDDGEELSVEHGDLQVLLGGMTAELFDSTVSIGQMKAEPGQELSDALANYAANYYETGGGEFDLSGVLRSLSEKKRAALRELRREAEVCGAEQEKLTQEIKYLEEDIRQLRMEYREKEKELKDLENAESREETERSTAPHGPAGIASRTKAALMAVGGFAMICMGAAGLLQSRGMPGGLPEIMLALITGAAGLAGLILFAAGIIKLRARTEAQSASAERADVQNADSDTQRRLSWELERLQSEWKEKELRCGNIREQYEEQGKSEKQLRLEEQCRALEIAEERMQKAARVTGASMDRRVSRRASEIFSAVTDGRYHSVEISRQKGITVWDGVRRIPVERLSRGTIEQIYFSVRMAAAETLAEEPVPIILDDVFAFYDDKRLESVLKWLSRQEKQVIIFTCHKREERMLNAAQGK